MDVLILAGGKGTRLQSIVSDRPKPMALFYGKPFLDFLLEYIFQQGDHRVILCVGHQGHYIEEYYQNHPFSHSIFISQEEKPLGTAGAIKLAEPLIQDQTFAVMNGDSFCPFKLDNLKIFHQQKGAEISILLAPIEKRTDGGNVTIDEDGKVVSFLEKANSIPSSQNIWINAGIYIFQKSCLANINRNQLYSLERDLIPYLIDQKKCYANISLNKVVDIGTPDRFFQAQNLLMHYLNVNNTNSP